MVKKSDNNSWLIEHSCSQCGAPITLEETDRLITCPFCRVRICLTTSDHFSYYIPAPERASSDTFYVPYWRVRGTVFSCDGDFELRQSILDASYRAYTDRFFPESLGLRPQAMKLRFVTPEVGEIFLTPSLGFDEAFSRVQAALPLNRQEAGIATKPYLRTFLGETSSLVYAPFYFRDRFIFDGVLGEALRRGPDTDYAPGPRGKAGWSMKVVPALCPECGHDLEGGRGSVAFFCVNCSKAWYLSGTGLERMPFAVMPGGDDAAVHLPFWRIKAHVGGFSLQSFGDLVRLANLPRAVKPEWESQEVFLWVPAFKVHAGLLLRLSRQMTIDQPTGAREGERSPSSPYPVTFPIDEAGESLKILIASLMAAKRRHWPMLKDVTVAPWDHLLVYVPFRQQLDELTSLPLKLTVNVNALKFGQNL